MGLWQSLQGMVQIEITGTDVSRSLRRLSEAGIVLQKTTYSGDLCVLSWVSRKDSRRIAEILVPLGDGVKEKKRTGIYWGLASLLHRPVLVLGLACIVVFYVFLSTRVLFVTVKGNSRIPARYILEQAENYGLSFGVGNRAVRSERIKNGLLEAIPQLQWVGVNISGCVAEISVEEKPGKEEEMQAPSHKVSHIVAGKDGIILSCTVKEGNALCTVGQAVRKGQILVSGYIDCGISIQAVRADGEIFGQTLQNLQALMPAASEARGLPVKETYVYTLIVGSKQFSWGDTQAWDSNPVNTVKTVQRQRLTLPGGFVLPVTLEKTTYTFYESEETTLWNQWDMTEYVKSYLLSHMIAGEILESQEDFEQGEGILELRGKYRCREMIGVEIPAGLPDEKSALPQG